MPNACMHANSVGRQTPIVTIFSNTQPGSDVKKHVLSLYDIYFVLLFLAATGENRKNIAQNNTKHRFNLYRMNTFMFSHPHVSSNVLDPQKKTNRRHNKCIHYVTGSPGQLGAQGPIWLPSPACPQSHKVWGLERGPRCLFHKFLLYFVGEENWELIFARNDWGNTNW